MAHPLEETPTTPAAEDSTNNPVIARMMPLIMHLAYEVDPWVQVALNPYRWHGEDVLDIGLIWQGHEHHLEVTADRLEIIERDPHMLEHDIAGAVGDMKREAGAQPQPPAPGGEEADHSHVHLNRRQRRALIQARAQGAIIPPVPPPPVPHTGPGEVVLSPAEPAARAAHEDAPPAAQSGPAVTAAPAAPAALSSEEQQVLDATVALARDIVHHLDAEAAVSFDLYAWHGAPTLDVAVEQRGHVHHFEVTLDRARLFLGDHHMLEHDLEGVIGH